MLFRSLKMLQSLSAAILTTESLKIKSSRFLINSKLRITKKQLNHYFLSVQPFESSKLYDEKTNQSLDLESSLATTHSSEKNLKRNIYSNNNSDDDSKSYYRESQFKDFDKERFRAYGLCEECTQTEQSKSNVSILGKRMIM